MARTVLVTGAAGFIGAALSQRLLQQFLHFLLQSLLELTVLYQIF